MEQPPKQPHELVQLEPIDMHGPIDTTIAIRLMLPDGRPATLNFKLRPGIIPTRAEVKGVLDACLTPDSMAESSIQAGTRLMTKPEFIADLTKRETGRALTMPGAPHFVPASCEIPHAILVHAIQGAGFGGSYALADEFTKRGLAAFTGNQHNESWAWDKTKLQELPDDMLLAIYRRITAEATTTREDDTDASLSKET